jgi:predicted glycogen debranching enzyme
MLLHTIETNGQLQPGLSQEWLLTNGTGAYSSSTVVGCNTRRYHGLLCAATLPPVGRIMALSRVGEIVKIAGSEVTHELAVNQFATNFHPHGEQYLRKFQLGDFARWEYEVDGVVIVKEVQLFMKRNVVAVRYSVDLARREGLTLQLLPFVALRDFHSLRRGTDAVFQIEADQLHARVTQDEHTLHLQCDSGKFDKGLDWWRGHYYAIEAQRGLDNVEDLMTPGRFVVEINKPTTIRLWASMAAVESIDWDAELKTRATTTAPRVENLSPVQQKLHRAANDFIVARKTPDGSMGSTVIAGYPWFADWGRDTMISLPGLFLTTGRFEEAGRVLGVFADYCSEGMIPNRFDDYTNEPSYNTVDASLWFIHACFEFLKASRDSSTFETKLLPACRAIIKGYRQGTRFHIKMDPADGLISQGDPTTQLTWMDAKCNNVVFTPRQGKAVEINALWYHALRLLNETELADRVQRSFVKTFWISPFRGLCDVVNGGNGRDVKIRPNQIFAVSLEHSALSLDQQHAVVEVVRRELLTSYGLRTLSPGDPHFHARYDGDQFHRDAAYHNGTIWPWLIGGFLEAYLRVNNRSAESIDQAKAWLKPLLDAMDTHGAIGQISEIYEAEPPHRPAGCFAQAWSVAEVLRIAAMINM